MARCGALSAFYGVWKASACKAWAEGLGVTKISSSELDVACSEYKLMENFVITMCDKSSAGSSVNDASQTDELLQYVRRNIYQACTWCLSCMAQLDKPSSKILGGIRG